MKKFSVTQQEVDSMVFVDRVGVEATVCGVGRNDVGFKIWTGGKLLWQYAMWASMIDRSFGENTKRIKPTYKDVTCCEEWLSFANFLEWANKEVNYKGRHTDLDLDKDILTKGNKIYSPEKCCIIPMPINTLILRSAGTRGKWPIGVNYHKRDNIFEASLRVFGRQKYLGRFNTQEEAFLAYKREKESYIKQTALKYRGLLSERVFDALMVWEVHQTD